MHSSAHLFRHLAARIDGEVHVDEIRRHLLATDGSIFEKMPAVVVYPRNAADVQKIVKFAGDNGLPVHARGAGSGLCGASLGDGVVVDFTKYMNRLLKLDVQKGCFECQPGYRFGELEIALAGSGLFFPPDPSSGVYATFGGMCATNASGAHSAKYGHTADYLLDADLVLADGSLCSLADIAETRLEDLPQHLRALFQLYQANATAIEAAYPPVACNVAGYNLRGLVNRGRLILHRLLAGSEGTLGIVTRLRFRLIRRPLHDALVVAYCDDIVQAARATQAALPQAPSGVEIMDKSLLELARGHDPVLAESIPHGFDNVLLIEFDADAAAECLKQARTVRDDLERRGVTRKAYVAASAAEKERFWALRKAAVPVLYKLKGRKKILALVEDAAVPVESLVPFFQGLYAIFERHGVDFVLYGHIAKGLLHTRPLLDLKTAGDVALLRVLADAVFELVCGLNGTVSGEHGDGRLRSAYVQRRYPEIYPLMVAVKTLFDPRQILNPEIIIQPDADQMTRNLRYGPGYADRVLEPAMLVWRPSLMESVELCHGCSKCTTVTTDTRMCPVYKVTRDEAAAPKAKANVLRALISGAVASEVLYQSSLRQVMDFCVNCGSCFQECPSNVNIPKLAMEAKARFVERCGASLGQRLTAGVETAARRMHPLAAIAAPLSRLPVVRKVAAGLTGLAPQRELVTFARRPFYQECPSFIPGPGPRVLFYVGCYAAYLRPALAHAAVAVFKHMGMQIHIPRQHCCGLPHLSKGLAAAARRKVDQNLADWAHLATQVDHIVVTCSSCGYALIQDWGYLTPSDAARRIREKVIHVSQLVLNHGDRFEPGGPPVKAAYHQPCHLRLQDQGNSSRELLAGLPATRLRNLGNHCCGMAGSWGLMSANYDLSRAIAKPLMEELRQADATCVVTDCPTCQMQFEHLGGWPVLHPIELVHRNLRKCKDLTG